MYSTVRLFVRKQKNLNAVRYDTGIWDRAFLNRGWYVEIPKW